MKLTDKVVHELWGDGGPYSEINIIIQTRVLDTKEARTFLNLEMVINPTTFRVCKQNRTHFQDDEHILQILDHAEYRGKFGYIVRVGGLHQITDSESMTLALQVAEAHKQITMQKIIRMHTFTMELLMIDR